MTQPTTATRPARSALPKTPGREKLPGREKPSALPPTGQASHASQASRAASSARAAHPAAGSTRPSPRPGSRPSAARATAAARAMGVTVAGATPALPGAVRPSPSDVRHLRVVPVQARRRAYRRRRARVLALIGVGLVLTVAFGLVYLHVVLAQRQFALDRLTAKVQAEQTSYQNLRLQEAELGSPEHIISTAEGQLGMRQPASVTYLTPTVTIAGSPDQASSGAAAGASALTTTDDGDWPQIKAQLAGSP